MGTPRIDALRDEANKRIADKPSMVHDGDPTEELAQAYERHAERLRAVLKSLADVGFNNYLGEVVEGRAATHNIKVAVHTHTNSISANLKRHIDAAEQRADRLRRDGRALKTTESANESSISGAGG
ncbi:hypothetical protein [Tsukamurella sp. 1534]|uniref:hypothetical protein n=1 Tax=Tsukamurella sp. 1534 TaxID=1151061 RepID=UPI0002E50CCB|nr:hypothetical protein [Tsukamurella sp. 1534]